nr:hypothetical protein CFP56_02841 [Quercus suber]
MQAKERNGSATRQAKGAIMIAIDAKKNTKAKCDENQRLIQEKPEDTRCNGGPTAGLYHRSPDAREGLSLPTHAYATCNSRVCKYSTVRESDDAKTIYAAPADTAECSIPPRRPHLRVS